MDFCLRQKQNNDKWSAMVGNISRQKHRPKTCAFGEKSKDVFIELLHFEFVFQLFYHRRVIDI